MTPNIYTLLSENNLAEALGLMQSKLEGLRDPMLTEQFFMLLDSYKAYLRVQIQNLSSHDPHDAEQFYRQAYALNDMANRRIRLYKAPNDQYSIAVNSTDNIFSRIWASSLWDEKEQSDMESYAESFPQKRPMMVSAVTLALFEMFDEKKIMYLFDQYEQKEYEVASLRALVGIIFILRRYNTRIAHYSQILSRISLLAEEPSFVKLFYNSLIILQHSKLTESVSEKMRNDIIPTLLNSTRFHKTEMGIEEIDEALTSNGENPDWIKNIKADKKVEKKIRQMARMQTEGADIYMTTFRHMKTFSFFSKAENWFEPFSFDHPELSDIKCSMTVRKLLGITPFCDSDKYSLVLMINQMGANGSDMLCSQIEQQMPDDVSLDELLSEEKGDSNEGISGTKAEKTIRRYAQDLYRFFNLYPYRTQFLNPFDAKLSEFTPFHRKAFEPLLQNHEEILNIAEFFMHKGVYQDALEMFQYIEPAYTDDSEKSEIMQKMAFCEQKMKNHKEAYNYLLIADSLKPDSQWTIQHLALTTFELGYFDQTILYLDALLETEPDDIRHLVKQADCHFALNQHKEAIPILYKVTYLDESNLKAHQMLAWALLMTESFEKSEKEYTKCTELQDIESYIYLGHIQALSGNSVKAMENYRLAFSTYNAQSVSRQEALDQFVAAYKKSFAHFERIGINTTTLQILLESVLLSNG